MLFRSPDEIVNIDKSKEKDKGEESETKTEQETRTNYLETKHSMLATNSEFYTSCVSPFDLDMTNINRFSKSHELTSPQENMYAAPRFALLFDGFQVVESRGRLCFQEREDDEDMDTLDMSKYSLHEHIFQVISSTHIFIYYTLQIETTVQHQLLCFTDILKICISHGLKCKIDTDTN